MTVPRSPQKYTLPAAHFEAVEPFLRSNKALSESRIEAARMVMVENKSYAEAAKRFGWQRPAVYSSVVAVWNRYQILINSFPEDLLQGLLASLPRGWDRAVLVAPTDMLAEFKQRAEQARIQAVLDLRAKIAEAESGDESKA